MNNQQYFNKIKRHLKTDQDRQHAEEVLKHLKVGDLITVTRCAAGVSEYFFKGFDGFWMVGYPTETTKIFEGEYQANDVLPTHVTHINRHSIDSLQHIDERNTQIVRVKLIDLTAGIERKSKYIEKLEDLHAVVEDYLCDYMEYKTWDVEQCYTDLKRANDDVYQHMSEI